MNMSLSTKKKKEQLVKVILLLIILYIYKCYKIRFSWKMILSFFKYFFGVTCPFWLSLLFLCFFYHRVVHDIHLVFRWTQELNPRPRTMAQTVSPWRSPLDQGTSQMILSLSCKKILKPSLSRFNIKISY